MVKCSNCRQDLPLGAANCPECGTAVGGAAAALAQGIQAFSELRYEAALKEFTRAHQLAGHDADVRRCLAHGLYHAGKADAAMPHYRMLLDETPDDIEVNYNVGQIVINQGRLERAHSIFQSLVHADPDIEPGRFYLGLFFGDAPAFHADCYYYLAIICWNRADTEAAEHYFNEALELNPRHPSARHHLGDLYFQARDYQRAIEQYHLFLALSSENGVKTDETVDVSCNLGIALLEIDETERAAEYFKQAMRDRPGHPGATYHLNLIYQREELYSEEDLGVTPQAIADTEGASMIFGLTRHGEGAARPEAAEGARGAHPIVGKSLAMQRVLRYARLAAASDSTVLLTGENGTGKELIARAIHNNSARRDKVFLPVNCAAISESLIESELFGYEKGSFTGAFGRKIGLFEAADHGTIFLDEIGELDLNMQVKLLRFLQEREFIRVGGSENIHVDVRIIAATNQDLERQLEKKQFRQDLFFRLNVLPIHVPPLRERAEDIPLLIDHFLNKYGKGPVNRPAILKEDDLRVLMEYDWPGNIRELENVIERAVVLGSPVIPILQGIVAQRRGRERADSEAGGDAGAAGSPVSSGRVAGRTAGEALDDWEPVSLRDLERRHILRVLEHTGGNRTQAAQVLGINPATLWRKMKTYELEESEQSAPVS